MPKENSKRWVGDRKMAAIQYGAIFSVGECVWPLFIYLECYLKIVQSA